MEAAGIPHSAALGYAVGKPSVFVRKEAKAHGTKKRVEGGDVRGRRVVLVEDLVTTGGSSLSGVEALRAEGAVVEDCLAIISYGFAEAKAAFDAAGVRLHTLTTFEEVLESGTRAGRVSADDAASVRDWLRDPHGWVQKLGSRG
jgi:orotate phosphoribosyltransferase